MIAGEITRNIFFGAVDKEIGTEDRDRIEWAYALSKNFHRPQVRDSGERYFEHCKSVAMILLEFGPACPNEVIMGLLHDAYEDQFVPRGMIRQLFGETLDDGLKALSNLKLIYRTHAGIDKIKKSKEEYYSVLRESPYKVRRVKLANRLHNLKTMGHEWNPERIARKVLETERFILPIGEITDTRLLEAIKKECENYKTGA